MLMPGHAAFRKAIGTVLGKSHHSYSHSCSQEYTESHGMARQDPRHCYSSTKLRVTQCRNHLQGPFAAKDVNEQGWQLHIASAETFVQSTRVAKQATT